MELIEFDYWPKEKLATLVKGIRSRGKGLEVPKESETEWWEEQASKCGLKPSETSELAWSVNSDFELRQNLKLVTHHPNVLWLGDLCSTESRLALHTLGGAARLSDCTLATHHF